MVKDFKAQYRQGDNLEKEFKEKIIGIFLGKKVIYEARDQSYFINRKFGIIRERMNGIILNKKKN